MLLATPSALKGAFRTSAPVRSVRQHASIVPMAKSSKAADYRSLADDAIKAKVDELKVQLAMKRFLLRTRGNEDLTKAQQSQPNEEKIPKPHEFRNARRQIAQMMTVLRERELSKSAK